MIPTTPDKTNKMLNQLNINGLLERILGLILMVSLVNSNIFAQEKLVPLENNPILKKLSLPMYYSETRGDSTIDTFELDLNAFFDDFSGHGYYPVDSLWIDADVFINNTLAYRPISIGVATFDGLDYFGNPYKPGVENSYGSVADKLTSVPINLSNSTESDSIYLSFYFQAKGLGDIPEPRDTLVLEFKPVRLWLGTTWDSSAWVRVWKVQGDTMKPFQQVLIHIPEYYIDTRKQDTLAHFYHNAFQFRFMAYGDLSGNHDHWHLDYVFLNKGRSKNDTVFNDVTIIQEPLSLLKHYNSMPSSHLQADKSELREDNLIHARNMSLINKSFRGGYSIINIANNKTILYEDSTFNENINAGSLRELTTYLNPTHIDTLYNNIKGDTVIFRTEVFKYHPDDDRLVNNFSVRNQEFINYYAYDDGSAEMGYGLNLKPQDTKYGMVAYHFNVTKKDTLRGVSIYFNKSGDDVGGRPFNIMIWKNYTEEPLLVVETEIPEITDSAFNDYYIFRFTDTVLFPIQGDFYIGWEQTSAFYMNIGFDKNYYLITGDSFPVQANPNIAYYMKGTWRSSSVKGALMIRPIFSDYKLILPSSVEMEKIKSEVKIDIYPNPAKSYFYIKGKNLTDYYVTLFDISGKVVKYQKLPLSGRVNIEGIEPGFYIIRIWDENKTDIYNKKIIIQ